MAQVCIIGAGSSGIAAAQVLQARGIDFDCFEMGSGVGGNWRYDNDNGMSLGLPLAAHQHLAAADGVRRPSRCRTTCRTTRATGRSRLLRRLRRPLRLPRPDHVPHRGRQGRAGRRRRVRRHGPPRDDARRVATRRYDARGGRQRPPLGPALAGAVVPRARDVPGRAAARALLPRRPTALAGKRCWCSASATPPCDIAVEASRVARETYLAMRRGAHIVPKYLFGVPTDHLTDSPLARGPLRLQQLGMGAMLRIAQGRVTDYGLPKPDHDVLARAPDGQRRPAHPARPRRHHGEAEHRPLRGRQGLLRRRHARRGRRRRLLHRLQGDVPVPRRAVRRPPTTTTSTSTAGWSHPDHPGLYFIGLVQPLGAIMPLAEAQAEWVADLLEGSAALPSCDEMRRRSSATSEACASATSPRSGTPSRSTSTPTCGDRSASAAAPRRERGRCPSARRSRAGAAPA